MTKKELVEILDSYPDDAILCIEADHGQVPEQAGGISVSKDEEFPDMDFDEEVDWKDTDKVGKNNQVTGIKIW